MADLISSGYKKQQSNFINSQTRRYMSSFITLSLGTAAKHMLTPFLHSHVSIPWTSRMVPSSNQHETTESATHRAHPTIPIIMTRCISNRQRLSKTDDKRNDLSRVIVHANLKDIFYMLCETSINKKPSRKTTAPSGHCAQVSASKYQFRSLEDHLFTIIATSNRTGYSHKFFDKLTRYANPGAKSSMQVTLCPRNRRTLVHLKSCNHPILVKIFIIKAAGPELRLYRRVEKVGSPCLSGHYFHSSGQSLLVPTLKHKRPVNSRTCNRRSCNRRSCNLIQIKINAGVPENLTYSCRTYTSEKTPVRTRGNSTLSAQQILSLSISVAQCVANSGSNSCPKILVDITNISTLHGPVSHVSIWDICPDGTTCTFWKSGRSLRSPALMLESVSPLLKYICVTNKSFYRLLLAINWVSFKSLTEKTVINNEFLKVKYSLLLTIHPNPGPEGSVILHLHTFNVNGLGDDIKAKRIVNKFLTPDRQANGAKMVIGLQETHLTDVTVPMFNT